MKGSSKRSDLDLFRVPPTPADVLALRKVRDTRRLTTDEYLRALARLPAPPLEALRTRKHARGDEPFHLDP